MSLNNLTERKTSESFSIQSGESDKFKKRGKKKLNKNNKNFSKKNISNKKTNEDIISLDLPRIVNLPQICITNLSIGMKYISVESIELCPSSNLREKVLRVLPRDKMNETFSYKLEDLEKNTIFKTNDFTVFAVQLSLITYMKSSDKNIYSLFESQDSDDSPIKFKEIVWPKRLADKIFRMYWNNWSLLLVREDFHLVYIPQIKFINESTLMNGNTPVIFLRLPGPLGTKILDWQTKNKIEKTYLLW